jgi:hypothetical protein
MKKLLLPTLFLFLQATLFAQTDQKEELIKKNWNFGALPAITFDTDLGFQYGAVVNLYDYGDGSRYPNYNHSLYFEVSMFTKGSSIYRFYYNSDQLIPGIWTSLDISYLTDKAYDFYGMNGYEAVVNAGWKDDTDADYLSRMFYKYDRKLFRTKIDLQGNIIGKKFRWIAGLNLQNFVLGSVDTERLNKGKDEEDMLPSTTEQPGLYENYQAWGVIGEKEANGGFIPALKGGLVYDSRNKKANPMKGIWSEAVLEAAPEFLGAESGFVRMNLIHRQYFTLIPENLSFAYRLGYQTTLGGEVPFYYKSQMIQSILTGATSEGLGGGKTIRGIYRNRVQGDGVVIGNAELRWKFARFRLINNNWYLGLNGFTDFGRVTKMVDVKASLKNPVYPEGQTEADYFNWDAEKIHLSYGAGLRIVMNENFVIAADYGMATDKQDGTSGFYMGLNYAF